MNALIGASTAIGRGSQPTAGGKLVRAMNVEAWAICGQSAHNE